MTWIFLVMLAMIGGSFVAELILPAKVKQALGTGICWMMMFTTMASLGLATLALLWVIWANFVQPLLTT